MNYILNNPYRILGLLVGSSAAQQNRQITRLKKYIEAEQEPESDFSFPSLGDLKRTVNSIDIAASKLNLDADRMVSALFWFYNGNSITDDPAFDAIKEGDTNEAVEIWRKLAINSESNLFNSVTKRNASAFHNLSTFYLEEYGIDEETLTLKLLFIESDFFKDLVSKATDETYKITPKEAQLLFLNNLTQSENISASEFFNTITDIEFIAKDEFIKGFVKTPIEQVERLIEETKNKRKADKSNGILLGTELHQKTYDSLNQIKSILGISNLKYITISDKVADEVLQCGIDYFSFYKDTDKDPGAVTMKLFNVAKKLALGNIIKQRCKENTENLQEWIDDAPDRNAQSKAKEEIENLINTFQEYDNKAETVRNAKFFIIKCTPILLKIEAVLGSSEDLFLKLSERVSNQTLSYVIEEINAKQEAFSTKMNSYDSNTKCVLNFDAGTLQFESASKVVSEFQTFVAEAIEVLILIQGLKADEKFMRDRFKPNFQAINKLKNELYEMLSTINSAPSAFDRPKPPKPGGCYIATMAYGDYDHPQVMILRNFRDEKLANTIIGRLFIKLYYSFSPYLVQKLKNNSKINKIIRTGLDFIINKYLTKK